ncbi:uncharacterized protein Dmoj_GI25573 [Drosophila mojavensis]|uniref:Uncharacterized protein n=1 Tax=Drosophila mojavensis TaxID=7230 RepID=A0A0Q9XPU2_DROMO|nr:uncharacterized protein Dmoj_GI25573 [Drosophila mojavensis]
MTIFFIETIENRDNFVSGRDTGTLPPKAGHIPEFQGGWSPYMYIYVYVYEAKDYNRVGIELLSA